MNCKTLKTYKVTWEMELGATSPREAAELALEIQRDPLSSATVFTVVDTYDMQAWEETIDLKEAEEEKDNELP
ncbi:MAG: hypothetical protein UX12_C0028G0009 [Candidatus Collierbacteria bacterium GW2011_GWC1_45_47]|nr:MAG: hypothetical protein UX12_C0028G0009 [Candidatus Collierbacteria bacterium GW2011_GWC1_45_47]